MFEWGLSPVGWGYVWAPCNVYWLDLPSLNIEKRTARWITTKALPRGCMGTKASSFHLETEAFFSLFSPQVSSNPPLAYATLLLWSPCPPPAPPPHFPHLHLFFVASHLSVSLTVRPHYTAQISFWLQLWEMNLALLLLAALWAVELDGSPDTSLSDGERQRDYKRHLWIISEIPITHPSSISIAMISHQATFS